MNLNNKGNSLIIILMLMTISLVIFAGALSLLIINLRGDESLSEGQTAYSIAESGAQYGMLNLLRNPYYTGGTSGEDLDVGSGSANIKITYPDTGGLNADNTIPNTLLITSIGAANRNNNPQYNAKRTVTVKLAYYNNTFTILNWEEK